MFYFWNNYRWIYIKANNKIKKVPHGACFSSKHMFVFVTILKLSRFWYGNMIKLIPKRLYIIHLVLDYINHFLIIKIKISYAKDNNNLIELKYISDYYTWNNVQFRVMSILLKMYCKKLSSTKKFTIFGTIADKYITKLIIK